MRHIIGLLFCLATPIAAASPVTLSGSQLQKEFQHLQGLKKLSADFQQIRKVKAWGVDVKTSGHFAMKSGQEEQVIWEIIKPAYSAMKMLPQGLFIRTAASPQTPWQELKNRKVKAQMQTIFSWLRFDLKQMQRDFEIRKLKKNQFQLFPKKQSTYFSSITILLNENRFVKTIVMKEPSDDSIEIHFSKTQWTR